MANNVLLEVLSDVLKVSYGVKQKGERFYASDADAKQFCELGWTKALGDEYPTGERKPGVATVQVFKAKVTVD